MLSRNSSLGWQLTDWSKEGKVKRSEKRPPREQTGDPVSVTDVLVTGQAGGSERAKRKEVGQEGQGAETKLRWIPRPGMGKPLETVQNPWEQTATLLPSTSDFLRKQPQAKA